MDPNPHRLLHFLVQMKPTSKNVFSDRQKCGSHKGNDLGCTEDVKVFPAKSLKLFTRQIDIKGTGVIMQKDDFVQLHSRAF